MSTVKKQLTKRPTLRATLLLSVFTSLAAFYVVNNPALKGEACRKLYAAKVDQKTKGKEKELW